MPVHVVIIAAVGRHRQKLSEVFSFLVYASAASLTNPRHEGFSSGQSRGFAELKPKYSGPATEGRAGAEVL